MGVVRMKKEHKQLTKEQKSKIVEITLLSFFGAIWLMGLVFAILGMCAFNIDPVTQNPVYMAQKTFGSILGMGLVDFRIFGSILIIVSMLAIIIILYIYANKYDTIKITRDRRERMMKELLESNAFSVVKDDKELKPVTDDKVVPGDTETKAKIM